MWSKSGSARERPSPSPHREKRLKNWAHRFRSRPPVPLASCPYSADWSDRHCAILQRGINDGVKHAAETLRRFNETDLRRLVTSKPSRPVRANRASGKSPSEWATPSPLAEHPLRRAQAAEAEINRRLPFREKLFEHRRQGNRVLRNPSTRLDNLHARSSLNRGQSSVRGKPRMVGDLVAEHVVDGRQKALRAVAVDAVGPLPSNVDEFGTAVLAAAA